MSDMCTLFAVVALWFPLPPSLPLAHTRESRVYTYVRNTQPPTACIRNGFANRFVTVFETSQSGSARKEKKPQRGNQPPAARRGGFEKAFRKI